MACANARGTVCPPTMCSKVLHAFCAWEIVYSPIIEELLYTLCHKIHLLGSSPWHKGEECSLADGQSLNFSPPLGSPPPRTSYYPPLPRGGPPWPASGGSADYRSPCEASPPSWRPPAGRCWAAAVEAEAGGSGTAPCRWSVSALGERSQSRGGCDQTEQTVGGSPRQRPPRLDRTGWGGRGWRAGGRRSASEERRRGGGRWPPPAAAGNRRGWRVCWPGRRWSVWVVSSGADLRASPPSSPEVNMSGLCSKRRHRSEGRWRSAACQKMNWNSRADLYFGVKSTYQNITSLVFLPFC